LIAVLEDQEFLDFWKHEAGEMMNEYRDWCEQEIRRGNQNRKFAAEGLQTWAHNGTFKKGVILTEDPTGVDVRKPVLPNGQTGFLGAGGKSAFGEET
jgi:hypothetical protein